MSSSSHHRRRRELSPARRPNQQRRHRSRSRDYNDRNRLVESKECKKDIIVKSESMRMLELQQPATTGVVTTVEEEKYDPEFPDLVVKTNILVASLTNISAALDLIQQQQQKQKPTKTTIELAQLRDSGQTNRVQSVLWNLTRRELVEVAFYFIANKS